MMMCHSEWSVTVVKHLWNPFLAAKREQFCCDNRTFNDSSARCLFFLILGRTD